ncbi:MAG: M14 family metallopeptidase [Rhodospirillaceae bacterium]|nr:M14 family metallopeptidase [Rhodospirillaceae bacterium]
MALHRIAAILAALTLGATTLQAADVDYTTNATLPPDLPWKGKSEKLVVGKRDRWITPSEQSGLTASPNYADTIAFLKKMAEVSPLIRLKTFGKTPMGRDMVVAIVSMDDPGAADPKLNPAKPVLLVQGGIHSGEIDGKDAGLMLLRDIAFKGKARLIENVNFLFVPVFNIDGHERSGMYNRPNQRGPVSQGWRTTAQNLNLNRDYVKADAPEMRAMLRLIQTYKPDFYMDAHVTDGMDYQYDITYGFQGDSGNWAASPNIAQWMREVFRRDADAALTANGHTPGPLIFERDPRDPMAGRVNDGFSPRFSQTYGDIIHMASVLIENHSLKNYRRRVLGTYVLLEQTLATLARDGAALRATAAKDKAARPAQLPTAWTLEEKAGRTVEFLPVAHEMWSSPASGVTEVRWLGKAAPAANVPLYESRATIQLNRAKAYIVPPTKAEVIERLKVQGLRLETFDAEKTVTVEMVKFPDAKHASQPFEGRFLVTPGPATRAAQQVTFPAGSVRVPTDQDLGDLAVMLLDPESEDSFFAWGFFPEIMQRTEYAEGYVMAPLAERMMAADPKLKAEFEAKVAADDAFAKDPRARLAWFYARTPYYDAAYKQYPVGIER